MRAWSTNSGFPFQRILWKPPIYEPATHVTRGFFYFFQLTRRSEHFAIITSLAGRSTPNAPHETTPQYEHPVPATTQPGVQKHSKLSLLKHALNFPLFDNFFEKHVLRYVRTVLFRSFWLCEKILWYNWRTCWWSREQVQLQVLRSFHVFICSSVRDCRDRCKHFRYVIV